MGVTAEKQFRQMAEISKEQTRMNEQIVHQMNVHMMNMAKQHKEQMDMQLNRANKAMEMGKDQVGSHMGMVSAQHTAMMETTKQQHKEQMDMQMNRANWAMAGNKDLMGSHVEMVSAQHMSMMETTAQQHKEHMDLMKMQMAQMAEQHKEQMKQMKLQHVEQMNSWTTTTKNLDANMKDLIETCQQWQGGSQASGKGSGSLGGKSGASLDTQADWAMTGTGT